MSTQHEANEYMKIGDVKITLETTNGENIILETTFANRPLQSYQKMVILRTESETEADGWHIPFEELHIIAEGLLKIADIYNVNSDL